MCRLKTNFKTFWSGCRFTTKSGQSTESHGPAPHRPRLLPSAPHESYSPHAAWSGAMAAWSGRAGSRGRPVALSHRVTRAAPCSGRVPLPPPHGQRLPGRQAGACVSAGRAVPECAPRREPAAPRVLTGTRRRWWSRFRPPSQAEVVSRVNSHVPDGRGRGAAFRAFVLLRVSSGGVACFLVRCSLQTFP